MAKTCIKCGYTRRESDTGPDYACPACGVVYAKAEAAHAQLAVAKARATAIAAAQAEALTKARAQQPAPQGPAAEVPPVSAKTDAMLQQLMAAQQGQRRGPNPYKGMALVALVCFSLGFASAAGLYSGAAKFAKQTPAGVSSAARCPK